MTRREAIRNTVGALFGVSIIPAAFAKPAFPIRTSKIYIRIPTKDGSVKFRQLADEERDPYTGDISTATKIHMKEMWG